MVTVVIGSQWGDEGKGKIIDFLSLHADYIVRYHGGNNAGHTVINEFGKFPLRLIPSGIFSKKAKACIANGTVIDLEVLLAEIVLLEKAGISLKNKLFISPRCQLIMPYHKILDKLYEEAKGTSRTGTTGRGIGPVYADKVSYNGIRLIDLVVKKQFSQKLSVQLRVKNKIIVALGEKALRKKDVEKYFFKLRQKILPFVKEPFPLLQKALLQNKHILCEGAQGVFLDNDWGTYPFVSASTTLSGGITAGAGIPPTKIDQVLGVVKAYTTRVGEGPFPTELFDATGDQLRKDGAEFGTNTGRARRCGWFDAELVRFATEVNGFTDIILTKLDVLDSFKTIKICTGYTYKGKRVRYFDGDAEFLKRVKPMYKKLKGWNTNTKGITVFDKLPHPAKKYIEAIETYCGIPVKFIATGPEREAIIQK